MKPNPPSKLEQYQYDQKSSHSPVSVRVLGWLSLSAFVIAVSSSIFLSGEQMTMMYYLLYGGFIILFSAYVIVRIVKRHPRCSQCQQIMDVIDVKWTPDQWQQTQGYELMGSVKGADGNLYTIEREKKAGSTNYFIYAHFQQWCACHRCCVYFLKTQYWQKRLFSTVLEDEFEQAKHSLLTDLNASEKMELAHKERLQGRQASA